MVHILKKEKYYICPQCKGKMRVYDIFEKMKLPCSTCEGEGIISEDTVKELKREGYNIKFKEVVE